MQYNGYGSRGGEPPLLLIRHNEVPDWDPGHYGGTGEFNVGVCFHGTLQSAPVPRNFVAMQFNKTETPTFGSY